MQIGAAHGASFHPNFDVPRANLRFGDINDIDSWFWASLNDGFHGTKVTENPRGFRSPLSDRYRPLACRILVVQGDLYLQNYRALVESSLENLLPNHKLEPSVLHEAMRYAVLAGGKRLRPCLALAAAASVCGEPNCALVAGCASEFVHCFSLIHDDLPAIDNDELRRGQPTVHIQFGEAIAILAGDALFALAFEILAQENDPSKAVRCLKSLSKASGGMGLVGGEVMDVLGENSELNIDHVELIHRRKTGTLIGSCCEMGGIMAGAGPDICSSLRDFGEDLGLAFQIIDDVLNVTSDASKLGKAQGSDELRNKQTYPRYLGPEESRRQARNWLQKGLDSIEKLPGDTGPLRAIAISCVEREG